MCKKSQKNYLAANSWNDSGTVCYIQYDRLSTNSKRKKEKLTF